MTPIEIRRAARYSRESIAFLGATTPVTVQRFEGAPNTIRPDIRARLEEVYALIDRKNRAFRRYADDSA